MSDSLSETQPTQIQQAKKIIPPIDSQPIQVNKTQLNNSQLLPDSSPAQTPVSQPEKTVPSSSQIAPTDMTDFSYNFFSRPNYRYDDKGQRRYNENGDPYTDDDPPPEELPVPPTKPATDASQPTPASPPTDKLNLQSDDVWHYRLDAEGNIRHNNNGIPYSDYNLPPEEMINPDPPPTQEEYSTQPTIPATDATQPTPLTPLTKTDQYSNLLGNDNEISSPPDETQPTKISPTTDDLLNGPKEQNLDGLLSTKEAAPPVSEEEITAALNLEPEQHVKDNIQAIQAETATASVSPQPQTAEQTLRQELQVQEDLKIEEILRAELESDFPTGQQNSLKTNPPEKTPQRKLTPQEIARRIKEGNILLSNQTAIDQYLNKLASLASTQPSIVRTTLYDDPITSALLANLVRDAGSAGVADFVSGAAGKAATAGALTANPLLTIGGTVAKLTADTFSNNKLRGREAPRNGCKTPEEWTAFHLLRALGIIDIQIPKNTSPQQKEQIISDYYYQKYLPNRTGFAKTLGKSMKK